MKCVIFDLDGTLADTSGDLLAAANHCFKALSMNTRLTPLDHATALKGGRAMLRLGLSREGITDEDLVNAQYPVLLKAYEVSISQHTTFYPQALNVVKKLKTKGYGVGIATNKPEYLAEKLLSDLGARHYFDALIGVDTLDVHKPHPKHFTQTVHMLGGNPKQSLLVGDTITDLDTAKNANVPCILVDFMNNENNVRDLKADNYIEHFDGLIRQVERLIGLPDRI